MSRRVYIGTFNLFNMVLPEHTYYGNRVYRQDEFQKKVRWVSRQLEQMRCDVIGFQEVFHSQALKECMSRAEGYEKAQLVVLGETGEQPVVGLLSKFPVLSSESISDFPQEALLSLDGVQLPRTKFQRAVLKVVIDFPNCGPVTVLVLHMKSKRPEYIDGEEERTILQRSLGQARSLMIRAAEAAALRALIIKEIAGNEKPLIVLGDLNDAGTSVTSRMLSGDPPQPTMPHEKKRAIWDVLLYPAQDTIARQSYRDVYYTYIHDGFYENLDHIMVSQEFARENPKNMGYVEYVSVYNDHLVDTTLSHDTVPFWKSDHGQVVATLKLKDVGEKR